LRRHLRFRQAKKPKEEPSVRIKTETSTVQLDPDIINLEPEPAPPPPPFLEPWWPKCAMLAIYRNVDDGKLAGYQAAIR
jgi:hypothetical protein